MAAAVLLRICRGGIGAGCDASGGTAGMAGVAGAGWGSAVSATTSTFGHEAVATPTHRLNVSGRWNRRRGNSRSLLWRRFNPSSKSEGVVGPEMLVQFLAGYQLAAALNEQPAISCAAFLPNVWHGHSAQVSGAEVQCKRPKADNLALTDGD